MPWPLEREGIRHFAEGLEEILVVEEKRAVIENQLKEQLYNWREDVRPRVDRQVRREPQLDPAVDRRADPGHDRAGHRPAHRPLPHLAAHPGAPRLPRSQGAPARRQCRAVRAHALFLLGLPAQHLDQGARGQPRAGRHRLPLHGAVWMDRSTATFTQMGGEGVPWIGQAPFTETPHVFANLGDGTYNHSGILAIRAAVAAKVNITYKMLFNDAVAMTGGQPLDGRPDRADDRRASSPPRASQRIVVVTDEPDKYPSDAGFAAGHDGPSPRRARRGAARAARDPGRHRADLRPDLRRREAPPAQARPFPDPAKRVFINELVCEGCGDCSKTSNCVSVVPVETEFGRKRAIDQSTCNKDYLLRRRLLPELRDGPGRRPQKARGRRCRRGRAAALARARASRRSTSPTAFWSPASAAPASSRSARSSAWRRISKARACTVLDMTGLAQKGGAVLSHVRIAERPEADPRGAHRRRRRPSAARLRSRRLGQRRRAVEARAGPQPRDRQQPRDHHRRLHPQPRPGVSDQPPWSAASPRRPGPTAPSSSMRHGSPPGCSAIRSPPICSCSATPTSAGWCRCRPRRSSARSS